MVGLALAFQALHFFEPASNLYLRGAFQRGSFGSCIPWLIKQAHALVGGSSHR